VRVNRRGGPSRILVIKLGALGDFVQAFRAFAAIRTHHPEARITLLTAPAFSRFAALSPWFNAVWTEEKLGWHELSRWLELRRRLVEGGFQRVYDLQTSKRSSFLFRLFPAAKRPQWSGIAKGATLPDTNPERDLMHTIERQAEQLRLAGVVSFPEPEVEWLDADVAQFDLPEYFALLAPGGAAHRPQKRWPSERYGALAAELLERGVVPIVLGSESEAEIGAVIRAHAPAARDLTGRTSLIEIAALARYATGAIGNDTGPMHLIAAVGCPSLVLFSADSDPALCAPRAPDWGSPVAILRREVLADLELAEVEDAMQLRAPP
jgi:ADP-heptose:LPS heptosyltransferase